MKTVPRDRSPWQVTAAASLWMATVLNAPLWMNLRTLGLLHSASGWWLAIAMGTVIAGSLVAVASVLSLPRVLKPVLAVLILVAAAGTYFMAAYGGVIDADMLANALQTDRHEASGYASAWLAASFGLLGALPVGLLWRVPIRWARWPVQLGRNVAGTMAAVLVVVAAVLLAFQPLSSTMRNHKHLRYLMNPLNTIYASALMLAGPLHPAQPRQAIGQDAMRAPGARAPMLVLVVGETGRSGNFGLNGYERNTTPMLERLGVASWRNAWSCGTSTAVSVPCMFSHLGRQGKGRPQDYDNLLDVLQRAGLAVLWIDNQGGCKGVCARVPHVDLADSTDTRFCEGGDCLDAILLEQLDARVAALPAEQRARGVVLVLHPMGSHGPAYARRSPEDAKLFRPECRSVNLHECSVAEIRNAYDNSIAYVDRVLASTIEWLQAREEAYDTAMVYVADHGESLGEANLYLHGLPYAIAPDEQKHVPWITWLGDRFQSDTGIGMDCVKRLADERISHDNYFHAVLGLLQVHTAAYDRTLDPYARCAAH